MTRFQPTYLPILAALLLSITLSSCDFQAAEDAFDDFDIIIGLDPIETVVNGVIVDAGTGELISARLSFSGPDANVLIDSYSDPIEDITAGDGVITFGIQNSVVPTSSNPVEFDVQAEADGYFTTTRRVIVEESDGQFFTIRMASENINSSIEGTASRVDNQVQAAGNGQVLQTVTITTPVSSSTAQSDASITVSQGTIPTAANGALLQGQITTQLRVYDTVSGLSALPSGARLAFNGSSNAIVGATYFKMFDQAGNVAVAFPSAAGKSSAKGSGVCSVGDTSLMVRSSDASLIDAVNLLSGSASADVYAYQPANGSNDVVGSIQVTIEDGKATSELCLGNVSPNVDLSGLDASGGLIFTFALSAGQISSGTLEQTVTISNPGGGVNVDFTLVGAGLLHTGSMFIPTGTTAVELKNLVGNPGSVSVVNGTTYFLGAEVPGSDLFVVDVGNPLSGSSSLTLPAVSGLASFSLTASVECPAGQEFDVQISDESLDAVNIFYRPNTSGTSWTLLPGSAISNKDASAASITIDGSISLLTSTEYAFRGVLGANSASTLRTTPGSAQAWTIDLDADEVGLNCN